MFLLLRVGAQWFPHSRTFWALLLRYRQVGASQFSRLAIRAWILAIAADLSGMTAVACLLDL